MKLRLGKSKVCHQCRFCLRTPGVSHELTLLVRKARRRAKQALRNGTEPPATLSVGYLCSARLSSRIA